MKIISGLDIGNGYNKGMVRRVDKKGPDISIDIPSCTALITNPVYTDLKNEDIREVVRDITNQAELSFDSPLVKESIHRLIGKRAIGSGRPLDVFDVSSHQSKAKQDLSGVLVLSNIACAALKLYFEEHNELPKETVKVESRISVALPISEYKKYRQDYRENLMNSTHMVTIHNFEQRVRFEITFEDVQVLAEGEAAQYAIAVSGTTVINKMLSDCKEMSDLGDITAEDILAATTIVGVDIGEGTVNFPVFDTKRSETSRINTDISTSFAKGYGSVLERALDRLSDENIATFETRKNLTEFLQKTPSPIKRKTYDMVKTIVEEETISFVKEVVHEFIKISARVGSELEVIYVYGGGSGPIRDMLYPALVDAEKNIGTDLPILYLDSSYSRFLNRAGLLYVADLLYKKTAENQKSA